MNIFGPIKMYYLTFKNSIHEKTIILFSLLALGITNVKAAIQYTDINPDVTLSLSGQTMYDIDLDGDSNDDVSFSMTGLGANMYTLKVTASDVEFVVNNLAGFPNPSYATGLYGGVEINSSNTWADYTYNVYLNDHNTGDFEGVGERFIGFRLESGGDYYYGWIQVELMSNTDFVVKSFGIEDSPNTAIIIGDNGSAILSATPYAASPKLEVFPTVTQQEVFVTGNESMLDVMLYDISGKMVYATKTEDEDFTVSLGSLTEGMYILKMRDIKGITSEQKIIKRN